MKLFDRLPPNLFSILVSKNKALYTEALFVLRKAFKQHMTISKGDLVAMLIASLDEALLDLDLEAEKDEFEEAEEEIKSGQGQSATAHLILRRLMATKWIEVEYQMDSFEEIITLPDYTIKLLDLLYSFTDDSVREYNSYVYSTYSALRTADAERDDFMYNALLTAHENTLKLVDELKALHNNIRRYHQSLNDYLTVNDILRGHFDEYKELIMDRIYHPLKTMDSVPRYKVPIMKILSGWLSDSGIRQKMAEQAVQRGKYNTVDDAMDDIIRRINEISDIYDGLDEMLAEIDRKRTAYTRASMEKMRYLLTTDRSIKGKLVGILSAAAADQEKWAEILADNVNLFKQGYIGEKSLYVKQNRMGRKEGKPLGLEMTDGNIGDNAFEDFLKKARKQYSHQKIMAFMKELMRGKHVLNSSEIRIANDDEFVMLVLATLKKSEKGVFYQVEFEDGYDRCNGYTIPRMRFIRREKANVD
ncbi:MAG TPA: Wadjet anti-phage system protein JetA family protein [Thermoclostridium sp.]